MKLKLIAVVAVAMLTVPAMAADEAAKPKKKAKGGGNIATQLIKQLKDVGLTEEQTTKIKEIGKTSMDSMKQLREESGITAELMKKRTEAQKALKDSGKKGKEMMAAVNEQAGLTEAQAEAFAKLSSERAKVQKSIIALLTDEQKAKLPERMQRLLKSGGKKDGEKKKKKDAA